MVRRKGHMIIRICTENLNIGKVRDLTSVYFDAYTLLQGHGVWKGKEEHSLTIDIAANDGDEGQAVRFARELAEKIKDLNKQEAILLEFIDSRNVLL